MAKLIPTKKITLPIEKKKNIGTSFLSSNKKVIGSIEKKVIKIDQLLKDSFSIKKKETEIKRKGKERETFEKREGELEKKKPKAVKGFSLPSLPKVGIVDWIKNFILNTFLGIVGVKLVDFLPTLLKILPAIEKVSNFVIDVGGKLLDGLATFIDWGYKAYDATRGFVKNIFGKQGVKQFDNIMSTLNKVSNLIILASLASAMPGGPDIGKFIRDRLLQRGAQQAGQTVATEVASGAGGAGAGVAQAGSIGAGAVAGIVAGAGLIVSAVGEFGFQVRKVAIKPIQNLEKSYKEDKNPLTKFAKGFAFNAIKPLYNLFSIAGFLLDVIGAPFRYAIELLRYPFLSEKDKQKQAHNLAKFDARIREDLRKALNMLTLGFAFKEQGSFGNIYGNKGAQKEMMGTMSKMKSGGTPTTGGEKTLRRGKVSRTLTKSRKAKRTLSFTPRRIKPGASVGGEDKVQSIFPNPDKPNGFFGWLGGLFGKKPDPVPSEQDKKVKERSINSQEFLARSNDILGKSDFFGPFFTIAVKTILGQKPDLLDYKNAGSGLNSWMQNIFKSGSLGFAGGGEVDARQFFNGEDYTNVIAKSVEDSVSKEVDSTLRDLAKEVSLRPVGKEEMTQENIEKAKEQPGLEVGPEGVSVSGGNADFWTLVAIASREDSDPQAWADIAQSIYNRAATGMYSGGKSIKGIITASGQYEPTFSNPKDWKAIGDLASAARASGKSEAYLQKVAAALKDPKLQANAASFVGGRSDFMGESQKGSMRPDRGDITRGPGDNYFGWFYNAKLKGPAKAPSLGDIRIMGGETGGGGVIGGKGGNLQTARKIAESMGLTMTSYKRGPRYPGDHSLHIQGRAMDFSNTTGNTGTPQQLSYAKKMISDYGSSITQLIYTPLGYGIANGKRVGLDYWGDATNREHYNHVHVAYEKGGPTLDGPHMAMIGEKGREYVLDHDSYEATEKVAPGLLDILNYNVNDKASLQKNMPSIISSLTKYASYEDGSSQDIVVVDDEPINYNTFVMGGGSSMIMGGGGIDNTDYETLEML